MDKSKIIQLVMREEYTTNTGRILMSFLFHVYDIISTNTNFRCDSHEIELTVVSIHILRTELKATFLVSEQLIACCSRCHHLRGVLFSALDR